MIEPEHTSSIKAAPAVEQQAEPYDVYEEIDPADLEPRPFRVPDRKRVFAVFLTILILFALVLGPPLVNVSRYRREVASSISASLGRPVHLDHVALNLLPAPGFTLQNFVVSEDPAFGSEPILRANSVRATLRLSSLWHHKVEFSTITLEDPSVNLVHLPDGRWNLESILLQASRVPAAPTAQKVSGEAPRFPLIEATGARVNLKQGLVKQPLSLTEAKFSLWLPEPDHWHLRLEGHPNRTDVPATDTGKFTVEGTLGRASTLEAVPVDLQAEWLAAPLGGVSWVTLGRDAGVRGDLTLHAAVKGTFGANQIESRLELHAIRRADFVPAAELNADIGCRAQALDDLHRLDAIDCHWPRLDGPAQPNQPGLAVTGTLPELMRPASVQLHAAWTAVPISLLLDAARAASPRIAPTLQLTGQSSGTASCCNMDDENAALTITAAHLALGDSPAIVDQPISASSQPAASAQEARIVFDPILLQLGAPTPATLTADASWSNLHLHLTGPARRAQLLALAAALPQLGDGLAALLPEADPGDDAASKAPDAPILLDADFTRSWLGNQTWIATAPIAKPEIPHRLSAHKRR